MKKQLFLFFICTMTVNLIGTGKHRESSTRNRSGGAPKKMICKRSLPRPTGMMPGLQRECEIEGYVGDPLSLRAMIFNTMKKNQAKVIPPKRLPTPPPWESTEQITKQLASLHVDNNVSGSVMDLETIHDDADTIEKDYAQRALEA